MEPFLLAYNILNFVAIGFGLVFETEVAFSVDDDSTWYSDSFTKYHEIGLFFGFSTVGIGIFGFFAAYWQQQVGLVLVYVVTVGCLALVLTVLSGFSFYGLSNANVSVLHKLKDVLESYRLKHPNGRPSPLSKFPPLDKIQEGFKCCGISAFDVYESHVQLPDSCCSLEELLRHDNRCTDDWDFDKFCDEEIAKTVRSDFGLIGGGQVTMAVLHVVLLILRIKAQEGGLVLPNPADFPQSSFPVRYK